MSNDKWGSIGDPAITLRCQVDDNDSIEFLDRMDEDGDFYIGLVNNSSDCSSVWLSLSPADATILRDALTRALRS